jgi:two-component system nitrate/nitrite response regulator NarL
MKTSTKPTNNQDTNNDNDAGQKRILVVDDHPMLRKGVIDLLQLEEDLAAVGEASSGEEALIITRDYEPDLILLDLNMKGMDGIETIKALRSQDVFSRIVIFSVSDNPDCIREAINAGADGYILKDSEPEELISLVRQGVSGQFVVSEKVDEILRTQDTAKESESPDTRPDASALTYREKQILSLIANGMSNKMIARELNIAEGTVKVHVKNLLKKLKFRSRVEAAIWAMENDLK